MEYKTVDDVMSIVEVLVHKAKERGWIPSEVILGEQTFKAVEATEATGILGFIINVAPLDNEPKPGLFEIPYRLDSAAAANTLILHTDRQPLTWRV